MSSLVESGWAEVLQNAILKDGKGLLGICLGMQLLATFSYEGKQTKGLNLIEGVVKPLKSADAATRIPHVGWNEIDTFLPIRFWLTYHVGLIVISFIVFISFPMTIDLS